ncbi:MAG: hypothetical protein NTX22_16500 [Ignavibacteriales bacterium]|nr:hypothetical protein [Ignavibacteriales bacterium]
MKKLLLLLFFVSIELNAQIDISAGMGINFSSMASLNDYISALNPSNQLTTFNSNVEFYGEVGYLYSNSFLLALDYSFSIFSYTNQYAGIGKYELAFNQHSPTVMAYYHIKGDGYKFKLGGGLGLRYVSLSETLPQSNSSKNYTATGFGILLKAEGNTSIGKNIYATIALILKMDYPGVPKSGGTSLSYNPSSIQDVNVNAVSGGIRLGILYTF